MREMMIVQKVVESNTKDGKSVKVTLSGYRVEEGKVKMNPTPKLTLGGFLSKEDALDQGLKVSAPFLVKITPANSILSVIKEELEENPIEVEGVDVKVEVTES